VRTGRILAAPIVDPNVLPTDTLISWVRLHRRKR
jgi:hypothetical protein